MSEASGKQKVFARLVFQGMNQREAYRQAYGRAEGSDATCDANASRLLRNAKVKEYLAALNGKAERAAVLSKQERMEWLTRVVTTPVGEVDERSDLCQEAVESDQGMKVKMPGKIEAIRELNRMDGAYEPERVEVKSELSFSVLLRKLKGSELVRRRVEG